jgi:hypothetical protein
MRVGDKVRVNANHEIYPNREGIVEIIPGGRANGLVILSNSDPEKGRYSTFAVHMDSLIVI